VERFLTGLVRKLGATLTFETVLVNGATAALLHLDGELVTAAALRVDDGRVTELYFVRNPDKLTRLGGEGAPLSR
jgi:hypothetical protein